jgi:hypothetical protein
MAQQSCRHLQCGLVTNHVWDLSEVVVLIDSAEME